MNQGHDSHAITSNTVQTVQTVQYWICRAQLLHDDEARHARTECHPVEEREELARGYIGVCQDVIVGTPFLRVCTEYSVYHSLTEHSSMRQRNKSYVEFGIC